MKAWYRYTNKQNMYPINSMNEFSNCCIFKSKTYDAFGIIVCLRRLSWDDVATSLSRKFDDRPQLNACFSA